jgi:phosphomannomutase
MARPTDALLPDLIFKAYDVRGLHGEEMDGTTAEAIGNAFVRLLAEREDKPVTEVSVGLGRDMRLTAPDMAERFAAGAQSAGAKVLDAGEIATEVLYFLVGSRSLDGGAAITASHNPKAYTGIKLVGRDALPLSGDSGIQQVRDLAQSGSVEASEPGPIESVDVTDDFREAMRSWVDPEKVSPMKVVVDGGNGMAGPTAGPLLKDLPIELVPLFFEPNGEFPGHEPNPLLPENRELICETVVEQKADLGMAWDGDADRCFFVDEEGRFVDGDFLTALLAQTILERDPGAEVLYDVRASRAVPDLVEAVGGTARMSRVGHAFFKALMRETGAVFGGEVSGHYYFRDFYCADSGTIPALLVCELLSERGSSMSQILEPLRDRYFISGEINSEVADPTGKLREIAEEFTDAEISTLDGVSVDYPDWHFNLRASNTEPLLRLNLESLVSPDDMTEKRDMLLGMIRS